MYFSSQYLHRYRESAQLHFRDAASWASTDSHRLMRHDFPTPVSPIDNTFIRRYLGSLRTLAAALSALMAGQWCQTFLVAQQALTHLTSKLWPISTASYIKRYAFCRFKSLVQQVSSHQSAFGFDTAHDARIQQSRQTTIPLRCCHGTSDMILGLRLGVQ